MASNSSTPVNGVSTNKSSTKPPPSTLPSGLGKAVGKLNATSKSVDGVRKQTGNGPDGQQSQKPPQQRAWTGTNPITQRTASPSAPNGTVNQSKQSTPAKGLVSPATELNGGEKHGHDRLLFLLANFAGLPAHITLRTGEQYRGIFSTASAQLGEMSYTLKMVRRPNSSNNEQLNGVSETSEEYAGKEEDDYSMSFNVKDVVDLAVANVTATPTLGRAQNGNASTFKTDADIAGRMGAGERELTRWVDDTNTVTPNATMLASSVGDWDQFKENERRFGLKSDYAEEIYTTAIDTSHPLYKQRAAAAEQAARDMEVEIAKRIQGRSLVEDDLDEEERYAGVRREYPPLASGQPNTYTPPARRAPPLHHPTSTALPLDPAIISSHVARSDPPSHLSNEEQAKLPRTQETEIPRRISTLKADTLAQPTSERGHPPVTASRTTAETQVPTQVGPTSSGMAPPSLANRTTAGHENATANVESEVLDSFKAFAASEKIRVQERQLERQAAKARQEKRNRLEELKKFADSFKLNSRVPSDLVPILAKDKSKQEEIVQKAERQALAHEKDGTPPKPTVSVASLQSQRTGAAALPAQDEQDSPHTHSDHASAAGARTPLGPSTALSPRTERVGQTHNMPLPPRRGPGHLSQRLAITTQQHNNRSGMAGPGAHVPIPNQDARVPPSGPAAIDSAKRAGSVTSPNSAMSSRFNVRASEFKPNPTAVSFTPILEPSAGSSPQVEASKPTASRSPVMSSFFGNSTPTKVAKKTRINDDFNPIKRMKREVQRDGKVQDFLANGGIPQAYRTPPTWDVAKENQDKTYRDMFEKEARSAPSVSPAHPSPANAAFPHQHQLPLHLQGAPQTLPLMRTPSQTPRHQHLQMQHLPGAPYHTEDHRMHPSSSSSSAWPSPRPHVIFTQPMPQHMQLAQQPPYAFGPGTPVTQVRHQSQGAHFQHPQHFGGQMFVQPSGSYQAMGQHLPVMPLAGQVPAAYVLVPQQALQGPYPPAGSGYGSPRAAPMSHQGSQQGHHMQQVPMMHGSPGQAMMNHQSPGHMTPARPYGMPYQPNFNSGSPHHHAHQLTHRTISSSSYNQQIPHPLSYPGQQPPPGPGVHVLNGIDGEK